MSSGLFSMVIALVAGLGLAIQPPTNALLARASGSVLLAALVSFLVGTVALVGLWLATDRTPPSALRGVPAYAWAGGLYGAFYVMAAAFVVPRLGVATMTVLMIASQLALALVLDHFGLLGVPRNPVNISRVMGVLLVVGGVVLVRRG